MTLTASIGALNENATNGTWSWSYTPPDGPASTTVTITATDTGGLTATTSFTLNVLNVPPTITAFSVPANGAEGSPVNLSAAATDPAGANDTLTSTWTITGPNGSTFATLTQAASSIPPDNGNYGVSLIVSDGDGGIASRVAAPMGIVSWWRGQGNANDAQAANNGTLVGGVTFAAGEVGKCLQVQRDRRSVGPSRPSLNITTAITLESWIEPSTLAFNRKLWGDHRQEQRHYRGITASLSIRACALHLSYFNAVRNQCHP